MRCSAVREGHRMSRQRASTLLVALVGGTIPLRALPVIAAPPASCTPGALATLPDLFSKATASGLRGDWRAARATLEVPLLIDTPSLSAELDCCVPVELVPTVFGATSAPEANKATVGAVAEYLREVRFQAEGGRIPDSDDAADLLRTTRKARAAVQRYLVARPQAALR